MFIFTFENACQRGSWNSRKFNEKWLTHICELKAQLELPSEALCKGISGSNISELRNRFSVFQKYMQILLCVLAILHEFKGIP